jgi:FdhE protein
MTAEQMSTNDQLIQRLRALALEYAGLPDLGKAVQIYSAILPLLENADFQIAPVSITHEQVTSKMEMGLPLLLDLDLELDILAVSRVMIQMAGALENILAGAISQIGLALKENRLNVSDLLTHVITSEKNLVVSTAKSLQLDPDLVWMLARNALKPALRAWCRQLTPIAEGIPWDYGYCFVCGAGAMLGELRQDNQVRHLRCGQCGADWRFPRLQCMYCGNADHHSLGYLYSEDRPNMIQVEVCDKCSGYLKVITTYAPTAPEMLAVEDLANLNLDHRARERDYARRAVNHPSKEMKVQPEGVSHA